MREMLNTLYRECSVRPVSEHYQGLALAQAAQVLGSTGIPAGQVREAYYALQVAFDNSPRPAN